MVWCKNVDNNYIYSLNTIHLLNDEKNLLQSIKLLMRYDNCQIAHLITEYSLLISNTNIVLEEFQRILKQNTQHPINFNIRHVAILIEVQISWNCIPLRNFITNMHILSTNLLEQVWKNTPVSLMNDSKYRLDLCKATYI